MVMCIILSVYIHNTVVNSLESEDFLLIVFYINLQDDTFLPLILRTPHLLGSSWQCLTDGKINAWRKPHIISAGRKTVHFANWLLQETAVLQYPHLPHVLLCWERDTRQETDPAKAAMNLWHGGKCDWMRPIPIWAGSRCHTWRFMMGMTQPITLSYWKELDMVWFRLLLLCVFVFMKGQMEPQHSSYVCSCH